MIFVLVVKILEVAFEYFGCCSMKSLDGSSNMGSKCLKIESFVYDNFSQIEHVLTEQANTRLGIKLYCAYYYKSYKLLLDFVDYYVFPSYQPFLSTCLTSHSWR